MAEQPTLATFTPFLDTDFAVRAGDRTVALRLVLAAPFAKVAAPAGIALRDDPFQLQFQEPVWTLPQDIYQFEHPALGSVAIFIVPIGPNADQTGFLYQAIFN